MADIGMNGYPEGTHDWETALIKSKVNIVIVNRSWLFCLLVPIKNTQMVLNVYNTDEKIFFRKRSITNNMVELFVFVNFLLKYLIKDLILTKEEEKKQVEKNDVLKGCSPALAKIRM